MKDVDDLFESQKLLEERCLAPMKEFTELIKKFEKDN